MDIRINSYTNFQSKANPVKPFVIKTKRGRLKVSEVCAKDLKRENFIPNLTKFFCKNFAYITKDPYWNVFKNPKNSYYDQATQDFAKYYDAKIRHNNDDMTLLLVKDKRNKIQGACLSYGYDTIPGTKDITCYIDSIAVNPAYRGMKLGKILIKKTLESAKNKFTDAFLTGDREAYDFYKKLDFKPLDSNIESEKDVIDFLSRRRSDYPKFIEFFTKPLQENKKRWFNKIKINE